MTQITFWWHGTNFRKQKHKAKTPRGDLCVVNLVLHPWRWVHLPPQQHRQAAHRVAARIKRQNLVNTCACGTSAATGERPRQRHSLCPLDVRIRRGSAAAIWRRGMPGDSARRCTYSGCVRPHESIKFFEIEEGSNSGGQDWSSLVGSVLCHACYISFLRRGTLERAHNKPLTGSARRCTYEHCDSPADSSCFHQIGD